MEQQQSTLRNEFFEIACDFKLDSDVATNDESLLDIPDILEDQDAEHTMKEPIELKMKYETEENSVDASFLQDCDEMESTEGKSSQLLNHLRS